jgi:type IV pilus assembly protein PilW
MNRDRTNRQHPALLRQRRSRRAAAGMTLIELMVAMAIGLFLTWGAIQVYLQSKNNYRMAEIVARLQENVRFTLETMEPDIRLAGYWGMHNEPSLVDVPPAISVSCDGGDVSEEFLNRGQEIQAIEATDDSYELPCAPFSEFREGTDVLILRHASAERMARQAGQIQLQSNLSATRLFDDGLLPAGFDDATSETRDLVVHAYYVDNTSSFSFTEDVPSLRRLTLVNGAVMNDQEIVSGVENFQVQFGLDSNGDGTVERYVDPDHPAITPGAVGFVPDGRVVAVRLWLLVRADEIPDPGFTDDRQYQPPDGDQGAVTPAAPLYPPEFPRLQVSKTVYLRNVTS